jgi:hypothetical protein
MHSSWGVTAGPSPSGDRERDGGLVVVRRAGGLLPSARLACRPARFDRLPPIAAVAAALEVSDRISRAVSIRASFTTATATPGVGDGAILPRAGRT